MSVRHPLSGGSLTSPGQERTRRREADTSSQPTATQRVREGGLRQLVLAIPAVYVVAALLVAAITLSIDAAVGNDVPVVPQFGGQNTRTVLGALAGAFVTVTALVFWVRILAVQFSADEFSSRMLRYFLDDWAQQHALGGLLASLVYTLAVLHALPDKSAGMATVPHLSVALSVVVAVAAAGTVVVAIYSGARQSQIGRLVRWLTDEAVDHIRSEHPEVGDPPADPAGHEPEPPPEGRCREVHAAASGWVQRIDENGLLAALPEGGVAELSVRAGVFVVEGTILARVWADGPDAQGEDVGRAEHGVRAAIRLGTDPTMEQDLAFGIRRLVDIAERSLSAGVGDSTTAYEVVVHLGLVLRELVLRDPPATTVDGPDGRRLLRPREHSVFDYVDLALVRIRLADLGLPDTSMALLETIGMLVRELEAAGLDDRADYLRQHAGLVLDGLEYRNMLEWDRQRVRRAAVEQGLQTSSEVQPA